MSKLQADGFARYRGDWIDKALRDRQLSDGAFRLLVCLANRFLNREKRTCWPSQERLAEEAGMRVRTVQKHLSELQKRSLIRIKRQGRDRPNVYLPVPYDAQICAPHDAQECADHEDAKTRKKRSYDPHVLVVKTRKNLRTNLLKEPFDKTIEGGGGLKPPAAGSVGCNSMEWSGHDQIEPDNYAPLSALEGRQGASIVSNGRASIYDGAKEPGEFLRSIKRTDPIGFTSSSARAKLIRFMANAIERADIAEERLHQLFDSEGLTKDTAQNEIESVFKQHGGAFYGR